MNYGLDTIVNLFDQKKEFCDRCGQRLGHIWRDVEVTKGDYHSLNCLKLARLELIAKKAGEIS